MESRIFTEHNGKVYIGGQEVQPDVRGALRDQARSLATTQLWEIVNASLMNEAVNLALIQSKDFDHVQFAKAIHHVRHFVRNVVHKLAQN